MGESIMATELLLCCYTQIQIVCLFTK